MLILAVLLVAGCVLIAGAGAVILEALLEHWGFPTPEDGARRVQPDL
jgi:hypothetical protein